MFIGFLSLPINLIYLTKISRILSSCIAHKDPLTWCHLYGRSMWCSTECPDVLGYFGNMMHQRVGELRIEDNTIYVHCWPSHGNTTRFWSFLLRDTRKNALLAQYLHAPFCRLYWFCLVQMTTSGTITTVEATVWTYGRPLLSTMMHQVFVRDILVN